MSFNEGIVVASVFMLSSLLLGGFYTKRVPFWLEWIRYLSFLTYSFENCLIMEFTGIKDQRLGRQRINDNHTKTLATTQQL